MLIACNNKGCLKTSNALLDEETKEVLCQECGKPITNISEAMKRTLKSFGQVIKSQERRAFLMACRSCRANREIVLDQNNKTLCKICHEPINTTPAFKLAMEESGVKLERVEILPDAPTEEIKEEVAPVEEEPVVEVKKPRKKRTTKKKAKK